MSRLEGGRPSNPPFQAALVRTHRAGPKNRAGNPRDRRGRANVTRPGLDSVRARRGGGGLDVVLLRLLSGHSKVPVPGTPSSLEAVQRCILVG